MAAPPSRRRALPDSRLIVGWPDEIADEIGLGPERRGRRPHPRREVRRACDRRGAPARLSLRRRRRLEEDEGDRRRAPARGGVSESELARSCAVRSGWTSAAGRRPRRPSPSSRRSSPNGMAARAAPSARRAVGLGGLRELSRARRRLVGRRGWSGRRDRRLGPASAGSVAAAGGVVGVTTAVWTLTLACRPAVPARTPPAMIPTMPRNEKVCGR